MSQISSLFLPAALLSAAPLSVALFLCTGLAAQQGSAVYEVTFTSTWTSTTHPVDFPPGPHFSPLIGGTHNAATQFWAPGIIATDGIEDMAESGSTGVLSNEIQAKINTGDANSLILGSSLTSPGSSTVRFTIDASHSHLSMVSMLAPSPDWFVGITGVNLIQNGLWVEDMVIPAQVWDAGTDSGTTYNSANQDTNPAVVIAGVTTASGPFMNLPGPVGDWTIQRIASGLVYGCGINPADSLTIQSGEPLLGQTVRVEVDDPTGTMPNGATTLLFFGAAPDPAVPCGTQIPGWGFGGGPGELLITAVVFNVQGGTWQGNPIPFDLNVPNQVSLIGGLVYAQGVIGNANGLGLTDAVEFRLGQ